MDLIKMFGFKEPVDAEIPEVWKEIQALWDTFHNGPSSFEEWEKNEGLVGLVSQLTPENIADSIYTLKGHELWGVMPPEMATFLVSAFIAGIRAGNELNKRRN